MTDDHNDMHEDTHDEETVIAGDAVHEAPSDYEFADDHHGASTPDHSDEHGSLSADATDAPMARRRSLMPILAAVGGVLVLGGVAWWQFGGMSSSSDTSFMPTSAPVMASAAPSPMVPAPIVPAPAPVDAAPLAPAAPPAMPAAPTVAASPVMPSAMPDVTPPASATALPTTPDNTPTLKPADAMNAVVAPKPMPVMPVVNAPVAVIKTPVTMAPALAAPLPNGDTNIQSLATRMDVLQKDVEHLTTQLGQMTNALAATATPSGNQDVQHRLDVLEQKIAMLHSGDATATPLVVTEEKPVARHVVVKHKPQTHKTVQVKIHKPIRLTALAPKPLDKPLTLKLEEKWVLRSATPGQAWISDSNSSRDLKQVKVGDTLPTIGRVTAIRQLGDDWVVQGTKGSIQ